MTPAFSSVPPAAFGLHTSASSKRRRRRKAQAFALRHQPGGVAHRRHLDRRLGAVDEAVEHLRIDRRAVGDVQVLVEDVPHGVGRGAVIVRLVARALAGGDHLEAAGARPVDVLADQRRLVAPGEAVDHARGLRLARQQRARRRASASTLTMTMCLPCAIAASAWRMPASGTPVASTITSISGQAISACGVGRDMGASRLERVAERGRRRTPPRPSRRRAAARRARATSRSATRDDMHAARQARLRQEHGAELAGADQSDGHRPAGGLAFEQHGVEIHGTLVRRKRRRRS